MNTTTTVQVGHAVAGVGIVACGKPEPHPVGAAGCDLLYDRQTLHVRVGSPADTD